MLTEPLPRTFPELSDEWMVVLSEGWGFPPARSALILRHHEWMSEYLKGLGRRYGLTETDVDDLKQMTHFLLVRAIAYFQRCPEAHTATFKAYLRWFVRNRGANEIRHMQREERHYEHSAAAAEALDAGFKETQGQDFRQGYRDEPTRLVEQRELEDLLQQIEHALAEPEQTILELTMTGATVAAMARAVGLSESTLRRRRAALFDKLRPILGKYLPVEEDSV